MCVCCCIVLLFSILVSHHADADSTTSTTKYEFIEQTMCVFGSTHFSPHNELLVRLVRLECIICMRLKIHEYGGLIFITSPHIPRKLFEDNWKRQKLKYVRASSDRIIITWKWNFTIFESTMMKIKVEMNYKEVRKKETENEWESDWSGECDKSCNKIAFL